MSKLVVQADPRDGKSIKAKHLRNEGLIPVIVYGKGIAPVPLVVAERQLENTLRHGGSSQLVEVQVNGGGVHNVLVREVQRQPLGHRLIHVDMVAVRMDEKQHVSVPVSGQGKPEGMASGMMVLQNHETIAIEALPADIPAMIEVDLKPLSLEHPIKVSDLPAIDGVTYLLDADDHVFAMVTTQQGVEEEEAAEMAASASASAAEPEVVKKGKDEDEE